MLHMPDRHMFYVACSNSYSVVLHVLPHVMRTLTTPTSPAPPILIQDHAVEVGPSACTGDSCDGSLALHHQWRVVSLPSEMAGRVAPPCGNLRLRNEAEIAGLFWRDVGGLSRLYPHSCECLLRGCFAGVLLVVLPPHQVERQRETKV